MLKVVKFVAYHNVEILGIVGVYGILIGVHGVCTHIYDSNTSSWGAIAAGMFNCLIGFKERKLREGRVAIKQMLELMGKCVGEYDWP